MRIYLSGPDSAATALSERLQSELKDNKRVLWLVSGGSNIAATVSILNNIPEDLTHNLSLMPVDERYGQPGHADSNWQQLMAAGLDPKRAAVYPVLQASATLDAARLHYEAIASRLFAGSDIVVAQLGMGADGHIAGILPGSPAVDDTRLVCAYESRPYRRLTLTFEALKQADAAYVFTFGENKREALLNLRDKNLSPAKQPAQFLRQLQAVYIYNDQIGEKA